MLIRLKRKYLVGKLVGNTSKHNDGTRRKIKKKMSDAQKKVIAATQPKVTLVVDGATGKRRFVKEKK